MLIFNFEIKHKSLLSNWYADNPTCILQFYMEIITLLLQKIKCLKTGLYSRILSLCIDSWTQTCLSLSSSRVKKEEKKNGNI